LKLPKLLAVLGIVLLVMGTIVALAPATTEVWKPKSYVLISETRDISEWIGYSTLLTYFFFEPEDIKNLKIQGYVKEVEGKPFSFEITNGKTYVKANNVPEKDFEFSVEPEELKNGLRLKIEPADVKVSIYAKALWEEKTYAHVFGGLLLGGFMWFLGIIILIAAFIAYIIRKPKVEVVARVETKK